MKRLPVLPLLLPLVTALGGATVRPARAYEAETTLAGLAQQAALASRLHGVLVERFGRSQGIFDPLRLRLSALPPREARALRASLLRLDPAEGYAPEDLSAPTTGDPHLSRALRAPERQPALGWLMAGVVLESLPPGQVRHHFLDSRGQGLHLMGDEGRGGAARSAVARGLATTRELMTGVAFDGTGLPAMNWLNLPGGAPVRAAQSDDQSDYSLTSYQAAYRKAVLAESEADREAALVQALLSAGAILGVLGQLGDPAHARNDPDPMLGAGAYQLFVAQRYGRAGVPAPQAEGDAPQLRGVHHLRDLFFSGTGVGLAERTAARFFSAGSVPGTLRAGDAPRPPGTPEALTLGPSPSLGGDRPGETRVPLGWSQSRSGYLGDREVPHRVAWQRVPAEGGQPPRLRFTLDARCHSEQAAALLPEVARYETAALDLLLGGDLRLQRSEGQLLISYPGGLRRGQITVLGEDRDGRRRVLQRSAVATGQAPLYTAPLPAGLLRVAVLVEGQDAHDEALLTSATLGLTTP